MKLAFKQQKASVETMFLQSAESGVKVRYPQHALASMKENPNVYASIKGLNTVSLAFAWKGGQGEDEEDFAGKFQAQGK